MLYQVPHWIGGDTYNLDSIDDNNSLTIHNPATGEAIGKVALGDNGICDLAINNALQAFPLWAKTPPLKRMQYFFKLRNLIEQHQDELAKIITKEHGKTLEDAKGSIARSIEVIEFHCGLLSQLQGQFSLNVANNIDTYTIKEPVGVCIGISPFNFPIMVPAWLIIPAIAAGNTIILKPSEQNPSAAIFLMQLIKEAGIPDNVVQCIQGDKTTVNYLISHKDVAAVSAVASTIAAKEIYKTATSYGKRAHTFGGAKNHALVLPDADLEHTANAIIGAGYGSAGERCMALSVIVSIDDSTTDKLIEIMLPKIQYIKIDNGLEPNTDMGPLISKIQLEKTYNAIEKGVLDGAKLIIDGRSFKHSIHSDGFFIGPTLFDNVSIDMEIYQKELFAPVLAIIRAQNFAHAMEIINNNVYGNGAVIFTQNGAFAHEFSHNVKAGMVGINIPIPVPIASHPFGGWKASSFGDINMHGINSLNFYTKEKTITCKWNIGSQANALFNMPTHKDK